MSNLNQYQQEFVRPWDMPTEIFWDITDRASIRRGQWAVDNCHDVPLDEIQRGLVLQDNEVEQLDLSSRLRPETILEEGE